MQTNLSATDAVKLAEVVKLHEPRQKVPSRGGARKYHVVLEDDSVVTRFKNFRNAVYRCIAVCLDQNVPVWLWDTEAGVYVCTVSAVRVDKHSALSVTIDWKRWRLQ